MNSYRIRRTLWTCEWGRFGVAVEDLGAGRSRVDDVFWACHHPSGAAGIWVTKRDECERCPFWTEAARLRAECSGPCRVRFVMLVHEMAESECRAMLGQRLVARLACVRTNQPYIVPIHVELDGEFLYGFATLGQKIEWMRQNPLVCLEIDELRTDEQWASVVVFGRYEELPLTPEHEGSRSVAERLFQRRPMWWEPASIPLATHDQRTPIVFRIRIDRVTGRRAAPDTPKTAQFQDNPSEARRPTWLARVLRRVVQSQ